MEDQYSYSGRFFSPIEINSKFGEFNKNKNSIINKNDGINIYKNISNINPYKIYLSPEKSSLFLDKQFFILNNSPISSKTINNANLRNLKFSGKNKSFVNKNKLSTTKFLKEKLNNSLYNLNSFFCIIIFFFLIFFFLLHN